MPPLESPIAPSLIAWQARHGRHDLPWQRERTPYRVWVSEVMLQQTQVATVLGYFERFMQRFPSVQALAEAPIDAVLHLWSGLGYYSRARNLHRAAQCICNEFDGKLPETLEQLMTLPGIGRSTAGAILAQSLNKRHAILDGNARRVLSRYFAVEGAPAARATQDELWRLADLCTPADEVATYTQAIMDVGATICLRRRPQCEACPLREPCAARRSARQHELPAPRVRAQRRTREVIMLIAQRQDGRVLLERRQPQGIWGGLWSLPEFKDEDAARGYCQTWLHAAEELKALARVQHAFTHFDLEITPVLSRCRERHAVADDDRHLWYDARQPAAIGVPAPIATLIGGLA
jgi:A/G-specific adenine glycosylase